MKIGKLMIRQDLVIFGWSVPIRLSQVIVCSSAELRFFVLILRPSLLMTSTCIAFDS